MSFLIKGMEMPRDIEPELVIEFADGIDGKRYARLYHYRHGGLTEWLEAVQVPPHGRLKDSTRIVGSIKETYCGACLCSPTSFNCQLCKITKVLEIIENAPTIIEAKEN